MTEATGDCAWLDEGFLTTVEAAELCRGTMPEDIRRWCHAGYVRYVKEEFSGKLLVSESDIRAIAKYCDGLKPTLARVRVWRERRRRAAR
jgi:predicted site-specific integrase-resolvase